jgi:iron complex outermembrane receptor protein
MFRGHFTSSILLFALTGLTVGGAQQAPAPATEIANAAAPATAPQPKLTNTETVVVTAPGEFRVEQEMPETALIEEMPGTSPIKSLAQMPSVNFQAADPYGSYEWAVRISVRGFNQNQLGFTFDDVPLGDMSYGNWNGLHISRAVIDENMSRIVMSQGTGALETASTSNLGGTIQFFSVDPSDKRGFSATQSAGSFDAYRTFFRLDSGLMGHTKLYLSGAFNLSDKWRGHGDIGQNYWQGNGKLVHFVGNNGVLTVYADYSNRQEVDYQDVNKVWTQQLGYNWDNYGNWASSIQAAWACDGVGTYPGKVANLTSSQDPCDAGYYAGAGLRKDFLAYIGYKQALTDHLTLKATAYGHDNDGRGLWFTPYLPTYQNIQVQTASTIVSPISLRTSEYSIMRGGVLTSLSYETAKNKIEGGFWYEHEGFDQARRYYATSLAAPLHSVYSFPTTPFLTQWEYIFNNNVYHFHLQDVLKVNDKLTLAAGFKTAEQNTNGNLSTAFKNTWYYAAEGAANYAQGDLTSGKPFLPQFGFNYKLDKQNEIFADAAYNVRSFIASGPSYPSPWDTNQSGFNYVKNSVNPETSWTEEGGYRYTGKMASAQASFFHVNFANRLLFFSNGSGIQGNPSTLNNQGSVTTNGIDGSISIRITPEVTLYNAATWNRSTNDDELNIKGTCPGSMSIWNQPGVCASIKGKIAVDTPEGMYKSSLEYHKAGFFSHLGADYMSTRYFTYSNDGSVGGRFLADFGTGYSREELGAFKDFKAQLNVSNLLNSQYYASIGTNGFIASDPLSVNNNTLQVGAPRSINGTLSVRF